MLRVVYFGPQLGGGASCTPPWPLPLLVWSSIPFRDRRHFNDANNLDLRLIFWSTVRSYDDSWRTLCNISLVVKASINRYDRETSSRNPVILTLGFNCICRRQYYGGKDRIMAGWYSTTGQGLRQRKSKTSLLVLRARSGSEAELGQDSGTRSDDPIRCPETAERYNVIVTIFFQTYKEKKLGLSDQTECP